MDDTVSEAVEPAPATRRDWVRAALWIGAVIIVIVVAGWILVLTLMCGCTTAAP
jgi:heme/copper-type cytochrome/quinol oxidase subunit 4